MYDFLPRHGHYYYQPIISRENVVASNFRRLISDKIPPFLALSNLAFFQSRSPTRIYAARPLNLQRFSTLASRKTCWRMGRGERKGEEKAKCSVFAYVAGGGGGGSKVEGWLPRQPWEPNLIGNSLWPCLPFRQTKFLTLPPLP